ncbi:MAG: vitamin K epoxide reductase family protein [Nanoarchaeota archaeon]
MNYFIIIAAVLGIIDAYYIYYKKKRNEKLACYIGNDCNKVLKSKYSTMFGIPNEVIGILYYIFIILASIFLNYYNTSLYAHIIFGIISFSMFASLVLLYIQIFVIKEYCDYCLYSFVINLIIFFLFLYTYII